MRQPTQRASKVALFPLALIAAVFGLPTYASCGGEFHSPAHYALGDPGAAVWVAPVFLCAGALAWLTARALRRGEVDRRTRRLGLAAVTALGLAVVGFGVVQAVSAPSEWPWLAAGAGATAAAFAVLRRARGRPAWQIWEHLLAAYGLIAAGTAPTLILGGDLLEGHLANLGPGAYLYLGALVVLWAALGSALVRNRTQ